ncbi:hypothetical protein Ae201684P_022252 [Aphanomyces euteiches]|uniref:Uncharacterized protein n=1 Tax=Aphanomyces euteiches TaxID=100861 RepID=A0A6G0X6B3_9STRA|nr:hypothetical protein Ae201684_008021 [Aphanomyces euteiches]KAH9074445.1 hypothetical protein Ae201684P_022252 [Aphanomyces euteiches]
MTTCITCYKSSGLAGMRPALAVRALARIALACRGSSWLGTLAVSARAWIAGTARRRSLRRALARVAGTRVARAGHVSETVQKAN